MFGSWLRETLILLALGITIAAPAHADSPGPRFKLVPKDIVDTITSPDHLTHVDQYFRDAKDDRLLYRPSTAIITMASCSITAKASI
jgi:hypothetical protein